MSLIRGHAHYAHSRFAEQIFLFHIYVFIILEAYPDHGQPAMSIDVPVVLSFFQNSLPVLSFTTSCKVQLRQIHNNIYLVPFATTSTTLEGSSQAE